MDIATPSGVYTTDLIVSNTNVRDVSQMLELWAHKDTPFLNRISWGEESGGLVIEWVHEHTGYRYVETSAAIASNGTSLVISDFAGNLTAPEIVKAIHPGTLLYADGVADSGASGDQAWLAVSTVAVSGTVTVAFLASTTASIAASAKVYIVGSFAPEGSTVDRDVSRQRNLVSNKMAILRKDIRISGSQMATDMHAVANELQHQIKLRLLEIQMERENSILLSFGQSRSSTATGMFTGILELMVDLTANSFSDHSTSSLTESAFNNLPAVTAGHVLKRIISGSGRNASARAVICSRTGSVIDWVWSFWRSKDGVY